AGKQFGVTRPQLVRLRADFRGILGAALVINLRVEGHGERFNRFASWPQAQYAPKPVARTPQCRYQTGVNQLRFAAARPADHHHEWVLADLAHQLTDRALRIIGIATAEEEHRVLFAEGVEAAVRTEGFFTRSDRRASHGSQQMIKFGR